MCVCAWCVCGPLKSYSQLDNSFVHQPTSTFLHHCIAPEYRSIKTLRIKLKFDRSTGSIRLTMTGDWVKRRVSEMLNFSQSVWCVWDWVCVVCVCDSQGI